MNLFKNADLLKGINTVGNQANVHTYAGTISNKQVIHQPLFKMDTWFDPQGISNILYISMVTKYYPVDFDTTVNFFTVHP